MLQWNIYPSFPLIFVSVCGNSNNVSETKAFLPKITQLRSQTLCPLKSPTSIIVIPSHGLGGTPEHSHFPGRSSKVSSSGKLSSFLSSSCYVCWARVGRGDMASSITDFELELFWTESLDILNTRVPWLAAPWLLLITITVLCRHCSGDNLLDSKEDL